jgi:hypothetical protein
MALHFLLLLQLRPHPPNANDEPRHGGRHPKRLWEMKDVVIYDQGFRESEASHVSYTTQQYLDRARECEWMASQAKHGDAKAEFVECAREWQELARQKREMEQEQRQDSLPYSN